MQFDGVDRHGDRAGAVDHVGELLQRIATGDRAAFARVYDTLSARAFGVIMRELGDRTSGEEVLQQVFLEIWWSAGRYAASGEQGRTWVLALARRRAVERSNAGADAASAAPSVESPESVAPPLTMRSTLLARIHYLPQGEDTRDIPPRPPLPPAAPAVPTSPAAAAIPVVPTIPPAPAAPVTPAEPALPAETALPAEPVVPPVPSVVPPVPAAPVVPAVPVPPPVPAVSAEPAVSDESAVSAEPAADDISAETRAIEGLTVPAEAAAVPVEPAAEVPAVSVEPAAEVPAVAAAPADPNESAVPDDAPTSAMSLAYDVPATPVEPASAEVPLDDAAPDDFVESAGSDDAPTAGEPVAHDVPAARVGAASLAESAVADGVLIPEAPVAYDVPDFLTEADAPVEFDVDVDVDIAVESAAVDVPHEVPVTTETLTFTGLIQRIEEPEPPRTDTAEPPPTTAAIQAVSRTNWTRGLLILGASLVVLVVLGFAAVRFNEWTHRPPAVIALQEIESAPDGRSATVEVLDGGVATAHWSGTLASAVLVTDGLPTIADGETFELWFVREDGTHDSAGTFEADAAKTTVLLDGDLVEGDTIILTVEATGGAADGEPTGEPILSIPTD